MTWGFHQLSSAASGAWFSECLLTARTSLDTPVSGDLRAVEFGLVVVDKAVLACGDEKG